MNKDLLNSLWRKTIIFVFYLSVILFFLFVPKILNFLSLNVISNNTINVYAFMDIIPDQAVKTFEKKTGIKINIKYFDNNEDLLAKFKVSRGVGYDLITVSDYMIKLLQQDNLLQKIDVKRLQNFKNLDKRLLNKRFDYGNKFSIPYAWYAYGIIYNKKYFSDQKVTWDNVFSPSILRDYKICMLDDALEIVTLASNYLFRKTKKISDKEFKQIKDLLITQKRWVESYTYSGSEYFLTSGAVYLAVVPGTVAKKIIEKNDDFKFVIPRIGSLMSIENLAIPAKSKKSNLTYQFIDFLISKEGADLNLFEYGYNPVNKKTYNFSNVKFMKKNMLFPPNHIFDKLHIIQNDISLQKVNNIWLRVRAK